MSADRDELRAAMGQFLADAPAFLVKIRRYLPDVELPATDDIMRWTPADLELFSAAVQRWGEYYDRVHDRVAIFLHVGMERALADGTSSVPAGFDAALAADDVAELDRLMSIVEQQWPDLFALPGWSS